MNEREYIRTEVETEEEASLLELLAVMVRRRSVIIKATVIAIVLAVIASFCMNNVYTATARVLPPQKDSVGGLAAILGQLGGLASGLGGSTDLYFGILKSRSVADTVIQRMDLFKEYRTKDWETTRKKLEKNTKFRLNIKDGIIAISASDNDPRKAALLANTFVDELQKKSLLLNLTKAGTERSFLEKRLVLVKQDLKAAETEMKNFQEKFKTIKADSQVAAAIEGIARLKAEIVAKEVQLAALRNSMTDESAEVSNLLAGLSRLRKQLSSMSGTGEGDGVIPSVGNAPSIGVEYVRRLRDLKIQEALFEQLTKQFELAKINEARDSSSLQTLDDAVVPTKKSGPNRLLIVIMATLTALLCSIIIVFIQEYISKMPQEDIAKLVEMKESLNGSFVQVRHRVLFWRKNNSV
jgi:uncharacterized protein involved in exopolysaccharide biosynthesis